MPCHTHLLHISTDGMSLRLPTPMFISASIFRSSASSAALLRERCFGTTEHQTAMATATSIWVRCGADLGTMWTAFKPMLGRRGRMRWLAMSTHALLNGRAVQHNAMRLSLWPAGQKQMWTGLGLLWAVNPKQMWTGLGSLWAVNPGQVWTSLG